MEAFECGHLVCKVCCTTLGFGDDTSSDGKLTINTNVREGQFQGRTDIREVVIEEGVTEIGANAFERCTGLTLLTLPAGLRIIGDRAFKGCSSLASVTFPAGLHTIGEEAFYECSSLASVTFGDGLQTIGDAAFENCTSLAYVTMPGAVRKLGQNIFAGCRFARVRQFNIGDRVKVLRGKYQDETGVVIRLTPAKFVVRLSSGKQANFKGGILAVYRP